jgi:DNA-binding NarL/FixJ family response regulator
MSDKTPIEKLAEAKAPSLTKRMLQHNFPAGSALSPREVEILTLIAEGETWRGIAERLFISESTVKTHTRHILARLDARNRAHAVSIGYQLGYLKVAEESEVTA